MEIIEDVFLLMMFKNRTKFIVFALFLCVICLLLFQWTRVNGPDNSGQEMQGKIYVNSASEKYEASELPSLRQTPILESQRRRFMEAFLTPINFYGRVIDQFGEVVPFADITFRSIDNPFGSSTEYKQKADSGGLFNIAGIAGIKLEIEVSKEGYLQKVPQEGGMASSGLFDYYDVGAGSHRADKNTPITFELHKTGPLETLIVISDKSLAMPRGGSPLLISLDKLGGHRVALRFWSKEVEKPAEQYQYDWEFEITVMDGGLVVRNEAYAFYAPKDGYAKNDTVKMPASLPQNQWRTFAKRNYFIRFEDGTFARVHLRIRSGGSNLLVWESYFNPKPGSRNLESDGRK